MRPTWDFVATGNCCLFAEQFFFALFICVAPGKHKYKLFSAENARCCLFRREMWECAGNDFQFSHGRAGVTKIPAPFFSIAFTLAAK
jgi:hypothetical protein